jgi:rhamnosyl/mannosyltransferase
MRDADVIALHAPFPLADLAIWPGLQQRQALVIHWHADIVGRDWLKPLYEPLVKRSVARADRILVTGEAMIDSSPFLRTAREKCRVAPYGIDTQWWTDLSPADRDAIRALREKHPRLVAACGRLVPYKGFDVLIRAMTQVDGQLVIVGSGPLDATLRSLIAELGLTDRVTLAGFVEREEQRRIFHAARLIVMSSVTVAEAFGIAQLEGMCCGLPVINTNLPTTVPHVARHEREGLTVEPYDESGLATAIARLLDDPEQASRFGQAGQVRARENYGWRSHAARVMQQYREALAGRPAAHEGPRTASRAQSADRSI